MVGGERRAMGDDDQSRSELTGSITRMLRRLPEHDDDVFQKLFQFYFGQLKFLARRQLKRRNANLRVRDDDDLVAEVLTEFLMQGAENELPTLDNREGVLKMLSKRLGQRAVNHVRKDLAQKRGAGLELGESALGEPAEGSGAWGLDNFAGLGPAPDAAVLQAEDIQALHARVAKILGDPVLMDYFLCWTQGQSWQQMRDTFGVSRPTVFRKIKMLFDRLQAYADEMQVELTTDEFPPPEDTSATDVPLPPAR